MGAKQDSRFLRTVIGIGVLVVMSACTMPLGPGEVRLDSGPPITGSVGLDYTNADVRERLVAPICARRGLAPATIALGPIEDGARAVRATCG